MSFNTTFKTYEQVMEFLKKRGNPTCFKVNYLPGYDVYELWIGNQPYESYEEIIDDVYSELNKCRQRNQKLGERNNYLDTLICMYRKENEQLKSRMQFQEGFLEKIDEANDRLLEAIKSVVETSPQGEEDEEMVLNSIKSFLMGVLDGDF